MLARTCAGSRIWTVCQNRHIIVHNQDATWRIVYYVERDAVVILEVFSKKTKETPKHVIETCRGRLRAYRNVQD
ncbi:MAG: type II toxin-antitoxin system RelE/ParE family toxin [Dehalococcoidia bacterium]